MHNISAIVLCGGFGTRLRAITNKTPKPMVKVANRPFLEYVLDYLITQRITRVTLAVSYQKESIINYFGNKYRSLNISYSVEAIPLGTGGAIKKALELHENEHVVIINGDTLVEYQLKDMCAKFQQKNTKLVMSIRRIDDTGRYGRVSLSGEKIIGFEEKKSGEAGFINTGVYLIHSDLKREMPQESVFSFEKDFLEKRIEANTFLCSFADGYFIDIGVPKDFYQAQIDFSNQAESKEYCNDNKEVL